MTLLTLLYLYIAFRLKHFLCDFVFQSDWMAHTKGSPGIEGYKALFSHALCHGLGTFIIVMYFAPAIWWLGIVDCAVHGLVDRAKGILTNMAGWTYNDRAFWWSFGLDQEVHNYTHLFYIVVIMLALGGIH